MSTEGVVAVVEHRLHRFFVWLDHEAAAVVTILLGLIQVLLSVPLAYSNQTLPKLFILPLFLGLLIVAGGSFTIANERNSSRLLLRGCACSNVVGLLVALLAFVVYCYSLSTISNTEPCDDHNDREMFHGCPREMLATYCWRVTLLLLLYDTMAVILHGFLSVSALKALKTH